MILSVGAQLFSGVILMSNHFKYAYLTLRILAIHGAKTIPPWYILLDYFTTSPSFKKAFTGLDRESAHPLQLHAVK